MNPIIGRKEELKTLRSHLNSRKSEFIAVYGRRRVGKTFLIRKAYENKFTFQLTGLANVGMKQQLSQFHAALVKYATPLNWEPTAPEDWFVAFQQLEQFVEKKEDEYKKVIFLDELPWLDTRNSKFLSALEHFWNNWASARNDIVLVVCGSAAAWMLNHLIKNRGGLHNRLTDRIRLIPFSLKETRDFLKEKNAIYDEYQILLIYMVFGGIPFYLDFVKPDKSAIQNINDLCFQPDAVFRLEYENLYASLFKKHERHLLIIEVLVSKNKGLTRGELIKKTGLSDGGGFTRILKELEESNFIRRYKSFGKQQANSIYQLVDLYSLFYLRFIKKSDRDDNNFWINNADTPRFYNWAGYAFEMVCLHHISQIKKALGIESIQTSVSAWQSDDAKIDLIIDRKDQVVNICEMKFSIHQFSIDKKYAENLRKKISSFKNITKTRKSLFLTMITTYGVSQNKYSGMVRNDLTMDDLYED